MKVIVNHVIEKELKPKFKKGEVYISKELGVCSYSGETDRKDSIWLNWKGGVTNVDRSTLFLAKIVGITDDLKVGDKVYKNFGFDKLTIKDEIELAYANNNTYFKVVGEFDLKSILLIENLERMGLLILTKKKEIYVNLLPNDLLEAKCPCCTDLNSIATL